MSIIFDNLTIMPMGTAQVTIINNKLEVTNIGNTGFDGIMIETPDQDIKINFDNINLGTNGNIRTTTLASNDSGSIFAMNQSNTFKDSITDKINFAYDFNYMANTYQIVGYKNGIKVFDIAKKNPTGGGTGGTQSEEPISIIIAVATTVIALVAIWEAIKPSKEIRNVFEFYPDGRVKSITPVVLEDPAPIDIEVDGQIYNVDQWGITSTINYAQSDNVSKPIIKGTQITCTGVPNLTIESILMT